MDNSVVWFLLFYFSLQSKLTCNKFKIIYDKLFFKSYGNYEVKFYNRYTKNE